MVDMDPQSSLTDVYLNPEDGLEQSLYDVLYGSDGPGGQLSLEDIITPVRDGLDIAPATLELVRLEHLLLTEVDGRDRLRRALKHVDYDFVIIDTSPSVGILTSNAMIASTDLIIPVQASYFALKGITNIMETYSTIKERVNEDLNLLGIVLTMVDTRKRLPQEVFTDLSEIFPEDLIFKTFIRHLAKIEASPAYHQDIFSFAPNTPGAEDFRAFIKEILERCQNS